MEPVIYSLFSHQFKTLEFQGNILMEFPWIEVVKENISSELSELHLFTCAAFLCSNVIVSYCIY